jgi:hypothetical protein
LLVTTAALAGPAATANAATLSAPSLKGARTHKAMTANTVHHDALTSHAKQNWYRFTFSSPRYVSVLLGSLPANYNLRLYSNAGAVLGSSDHKGTHFEDGDHKILPTGTYFVRVASTSGASRTKYALDIRTITPSATIGVLSAHLGTMGYVVGDVVNTSAQWQWVVTADVYYYGSGGKLLKKYGYRDVDNRLDIVIAPGRRAPYALGLPNVPQKLQQAVKRVKIVPYWFAVVPRKSVASFTVSKVTHTTRHPEPYWPEEIFAASVRNRTSRTVSHAILVAETYNSQGVAVGLAWSFPKKFSAQATKKLSATYFNWAKNLTFTVKAYEITEGTQ